MKKVIGIILAMSMLPVGQAQAWIGGPFSNNSYFENGDDGIYEAFGTMSNGTGLFRFAVRNNGNSGEAGVGGIHSSNVQFNGGLLAAASSHVWYYRGIVYIGTCFGTANTSFGIVTATGSAATNPVNNPDTGNANAVNNINIQNSGGTAFANSSWTATIRHKFPTVRFTGSGSVTFLGDVNTISPTITINPPDITTVPSGTVISEETSSVSSQSFNPGGHRRRFVVFGSRVSTVVSIAL